LALPKQIFFLVKILVKPGLDRKTIENMADLDDFFAKKDKKRSKKKYTTPDELVKKLEDKPTSMEKPKKERPVEQEGEINQPEEDEWKEIQEEQTRDYTGLKIGQLQIGGDDPDDGYENDSEGLNADGEPNKQSGGRGVWKKSGQENQTAANAAAAAAALATPVSTEPKAYVIPQLQKTNKLRKGVAPDISSQEYFPSLGAEKPEAKTIKKGFEEIKHGARPQKQVGNAPLSVENRFNTLSDNS